LTGSIIARRYARALFMLGREAGELEDYAASLYAMRDSLRACADLARVFQDPVFTVAEKRAVIESLGKELGAKAAVLNFWRLLADRNRLTELADIASAFNELLDEERNILRGRLSTAVPLPVERQEALAGELQKKSRRTLALEFDVNPEILGGVVLRLGDHVLDASLRAQLSMLKDTIRKGE
jgi:F-type H+-transporting ATPase subunit delta